MPKAEPKIWTRFNRPDGKAAPAGSATEPEYQETIDENGKTELVKVGETKTYEMIQASLEETKIENIIRRATLGDPTALNQTFGQYMDTTEMPTSLAEMQQAIINITNEFNKLPLETRLRFEQNPEKYIALYGSKEWAELMGYEEIQQNAQTEAQQQANQTVQKGENE